MPYLDVDADKFGYLVSYGTREGELQRFFKERYTQLILKGAKLRHPPSNRKDRVRWLVYKLPRSTDDIVRDYFQHHVTLEFPEPVDEILEWFTVFNDNDSGGLPADDARRLARSALVHLFAANPDERLVDYLKRAPIATTGMTSALPLGNAGNDSEDEDEEQGSTELPTVHALLARLPTLLAAAAFGQTDTLQDGVFDLPSRTQTFIDGLVSARSGDSESLESSIDTLEGGSQERTVLEGLRGRTRAETSTAALHLSGVRVVTPAWFEGERPDKLEIIGVPTKDLDSVVFVKPLAIKVASAWMTLSDADRLELFPLSGDTMTHRGSGHRIPQVGEYVHWMVEFIDRDHGRTRFHLTEEISRLREVIELDAASVDPDQVRDEVTRRWQKRRIQQPVLFALSDGLVLSPKATDILREDAFDQPWSVWPGVSALAIDGRLLAFGLPDDTPAQIDLSPIDVVAKRVVRSLVDEGRISLTRKQLTELAELLRSAELGLTHARTKRLLRQVEGITLDRDAIAALLPVALSQPDVQVRVDEYVDTEVRRRIELRDGLLSEVEAAKSYKRKLQAEAKLLEAEIKRLELETASTVSDVFAKSVDSGLEIFVQSAIFSKLASRSSKAGSQSDVHDGFRSGLLARQTEQTLDEYTAQRSLRDLGIGQQARAAIAIALRAADAMGIALFLHGARARHVAQVLSRVGEGTTLILEVPLGFADVSEFAATVERHSGAACICLLNADAAPLELYAGSLVDVIAGRISATNDEYRQRVVVAFSGEEFASGCGDTFDSFALRVDLSALADTAHYTSDIAAWDVDNDEVAWPPPIRKRLRSFAEDLNHEEQLALHMAVRMNLRRPQ